MATTMTLLELRTAVRQRADIVNNTQFFTDAELNSYINQSYFELYDLLVQEFGNDYFVASPSTITTDGVNYLFNLPANTYKILSVDYNSSGGVVPCKTFSMADRSRFIQNQIPPANLQFTVWPIPTMTTLVVDADTVDGVSGWTEYIIVDACIKVKQKDESDARSFMAQKEELKKRIESAAQNRDVSQPQTVTDTQRLNICGYRYKLHGSKIWIIRTGDYYFDSGVL